MKKFCKVIVVAVLACRVIPYMSVAQAQGLVLNTNQYQTVYSQTFDSIGSGLPVGWTVYKSALSTSLGTAMTFTTTATPWSSTTFLFANYASTTNNSLAPFTGTESSTVQSGATDRALAVRCTSGAGSDPGSAFALEISNTLGLVNFKLDLDFEVLSVQGRTNIWSVDYGFGSSPGSFTVADSSQNFTAVGTYGVTHKTISFGSALDNNAGPVWIRIATLTASTGSSSRPTVGIDNVLLSYTNAPVTATPIAITAQPQGATGGALTSASFTVAVTGTAPAFQWYQVLNGVTNQLSDGFSHSGDGCIISGSASPTLTLNKILAPEAAMYYVNIANAAISGVSNTNSVLVSLTVIDPAIISQPSNMTNVLGDLDYFNATAVGSSPSTLFWYYNGNMVSNIDVFAYTNSSTVYTYNTTAATNLSGYYLVASNQYGMTTSAIVTATIAVTPTNELARWDFNYNSGYTATNPLPSLGSGFAYSVSNSAVTNFAFAAGALFDPIELIDDPNDFAWALNGFAAGISNKTAGFEFHVSTVGETNIFLTWGERHSATASKYMRVQYTTNGVDWLDGDVVTFNAALYQFYSSDLSSRPGVANNPNFAFRIVAEFESTAINDANSAYAGTTSAFGSGGTIRVDLMTVWGNTSSGSTSSIPLAIRFDGTNAIMSWNDPFSAYSLQAAPQPTGTYTNVLGASSPYTNVITDAQKFFRLISN